MLSITKTTQFLLFLLLFSPLFSYISFGILGLESITFYFKFVFCFYGCFFVYKKWKVIHFSALHYFWICYILYIIIWSFYNGIYERSGFLTNKNLIYISTLFIIIIIYNTNFEERFIKNSILIIKITVIVAAIVSLIQFYNSSFLDANPLWDKWGGFESAFTGTLYEVRRSSIFGYVDQNEIGLSYMPILSVLIGFLLYNKTKFFWFFLILGGISAVLTNGRYIMFAFILITLQILIYQKSGIKGIVKFIFFIFFIFLFFYQVLDILGYDFNAWYNQRLLSEGSFNETTRYKAYENFLFFFPKNPYFGTGVHLTEEIKEASKAVGSSQIHVGYLSHLVSFGIVGSFFMFGFWFLLAKKLYKSAKYTKYWGSFFAFLIYLWAQTTLVYYSIFFYGLIFAFVFDKYVKDNYSNKEFVSSSIKKGV